MPSKKTSKTRYSKIITNFCGQDFVSIRVNNVDWYPLSDIAKISEFIIHPSHYQRDIETLLGKDSKFTTHPIKGSKREVNCVDEYQLNKLVSRLAYKKNNALAQELMESSFHSLIRASNDTTYGEAKETDYYLELAAMVAKSKRRRRMFTDTISLQQEQGLFDNFGGLTRRVYRWLNLEDRYVEYSKLVSSKGFRKTLSLQEINSVQNFELRAAERALSRSIPMRQAIDDVGNFF